MCLCMYLKYNHFLFHSFQCPGLGQVALDERKMETKFRVVTEQDETGSLKWIRASKEDLRNTAHTENKAEGAKPKDSTSGLRRRRGAESEQGHHDVTEDTLNRTSSTNSGGPRTRFRGIPSAEMREAVQSFERAVSAAIRLANVHTSVTSVIAAEGSTTP